MSQTNWPPLPDSLETISKPDVFANLRHRWNTNEEIASILICFDRHEEWLSKEVEIRYLYAGPPFQQYHSRRWFLFPVFRVADSQSHFVVSVVGVQR